MERLTEDSVTGETYIKQCASSCPYDGDFCGTDECPVLNAAANKLGEYERAEEQGLLVRLPRKVGDSVFIIVGKDISKQVIRKIEISDNGIIFKTSRQKRIFNVSEFEKSVFITREEATNKLEEMKKNDNRKKN